MSVLDWILLAALVVVLPGLEIARGLRRRHADTPPRHKYRRTILVVSALLALLAVDRTTAGRPAALLGLEIPPSPRALALIGVAALMLLHAGLPFIGLLAEKRLRANRERNAAAAG